MEKPNELFLIMSCDDFRYCLYRVCEPASNEEEDIIYTLDEPIVKLHNGSCPDGMSFAVIGRHIFMVGGYHARCENNPFRLSKETIILDTESKTYVHGPPLISPKPDPFLFTIGSKLFALSCDIYASKSANPFVGGKPKFEVLDTENIDSGWRALPVPRLYVTQQHNLYPVVACVALSVGIFISVEDAGTYAFDLDKELWSYVSEEGLPFADQAVPMPGAPPSICFAASTKGGYSAFHIRFKTEGVDDKPLFKVDEIELDSSLLDLSTPLPPQELYYEWPLIASDNGSVIYLIDSGLGNADANDTNVGNRYIKVQVCNVRFSKVGKAEAMVENIGEFSSSFGKKFKHGSSSGGFIRKCGSSEQNSEQKLVKAGTGTMKRGKNEQKDETLDETLEFKLNPIWRRSFFGGPMVDIGEHVYAAFAIKS